MKWVAALVSGFVAVVADFSVWLGNCDEVPDCSGVGPVAHLLLPVLALLWIGLLIGAIVAAVRHLRRRSTGR